MATLFYDHLIEWKKLTEALDGLGIDGEERMEVLEHIEHLIHTEVLVVVVSHLPIEKHDEFLHRFHAAPHDTTHLEYIATHGKKEVEQAIQQRTNALIEELIENFWEDEEGEDGGEV